jgi:lysophospholipase L1-like esterase
MPPRLLRTPSTRLFALLAAIVCLIAAHSPSATATVVYPNSIASTGDSITRAFNTGDTPFLDAPSNSWSTGSNSTVQSMYLRILAKNPAISGQNYNVARTGAKVRDVPDMISVINLLQVDYVTILIGANDVCTSSESTMTPVDTFRTNFQTALQRLADGTPNARVYVASIPNIYNLWSVLKGNFAARSTWSLLGICQSMLANPLSTSSTDIARRDRVRQHNINLNAQIQQVCALYPQCRFDNNAVFNTTFVSSDVSTRDYFHPSVAGQAKLANVTWQASGLNQ